MNEYIKSLKDAGKLNISIDKTKKLVGIVAALQRTLNVFSNSGVELGFEIDIEGRKVDRFFDQFNNMPFWYQALFIGVVSAIYGLKGADIIGKRK